MGIRPERVTISHIMQLTAGTSNKHNFHITVMNGHNNVSHTQYDAFKINKISTNILACIYHW
jgi:hypothetical protein